MKSINLRNILLLVILLKGYCASAQVSEESLRGIMIYNCIKNVEWPHKNGNVLNVGILGSEDIYTILNNIPEWNKTYELNVSSVNVKNDLTKYDVLVFAKIYNKKIADIFPTLKSKEVLIFTEDYDNSEVVMVNFKTRGLNLYYEVNQENIRAQNLIPRPELIIYGGNKDDVWAEFSKIEKKITLQEQHLAEQKKEQSQIELLYKQSNKKKIENELLLDSTLQRLYSLKDELGAYDKRLNISKVQNTSVIHRLDKNKKVLEKRQNEMSHLESEIEKKEREIASNQTSIQFQKDQIEKQNNALTHKEEKIQSNESWLTTSFWVIVLMLIVLYFAFRSSKLKRKSVELLSIKNQEIEIKSKSISIKNQEIETKSKSIIEKNKTLEAYQQELKSTLKTLRSAQNQLIESEKMVAIGGVVAGVAHEINTPIGICVTAISNLEYLTKEFIMKHPEIIEKQGPLNEYIEDTVHSTSMITSNLERAINLIKSFKMVAVDNLDDNALRKFILKDYIDEVLISLSGQTKKYNHKIINESESEFEFMSYPGAFAQIITNFVLNSITHGFEKGQAGTLKFTTRSTDDKIEFTYSDTGKGIPEQNLKKIFEPFFSTNKQRGGSGLGLHVVYNLVTQKLKGQISCESTVGEGCKFIIVIPKSKFYYEKRNE